MMNPQFQISHLLMAVYLSINITVGVAAVIADVGNYDDLDFNSQQDNTLGEYVKRADIIDRITDRFRVGRQLDTRELQDLVLSLPKDNFHYGLIGPAINSAASRNSDRYQLKNPMNKRQRITVPQLAQLLNSMKTRDVNDEGVKLQTLRFGK